MNELGGKEGVDKVFEVSFNDWSDVANVKFYQVGTNQKADLKNDFYKGDHRDNGSFYLGWILIHSHCSKLFNAFQF